MPLERRIWQDIFFNSLFFYVFMSLKEVPSYFIGSFVLFLVVYVSLCVQIFVMSAYSAIHNKVAKNTLPIF